MKYTVALATATLAGFTLACVCGYPYPILGGGIAATFLNSLYFMLLAALEEKP